MAPLSNEGPFDITFGSVPVPSGSHEYDAYLARPDGKGAFPTIILVPGLRGIEPGHKALARTIARHGRVVLVIDPHRGRGPGADADDDTLARAHERISDQRALTDIGEAREYLLSPDLTWADDGPSLLIGTDTGGRFVLLAAAERRDVSGVVAVGAPFGGDGDGRADALEALGRIGVPILGLYGADDAHIPVEDVDAAQAAAPWGRFIVYEGVGHGFLDPDGPDYHPGAEADAIARIVAFAEAVTPLTV